MGSGGAHGFCAQGRSVWGRFLNAKIAKGTTRGGEWYAEDAKGAEGAEKNQCGAVGVLRRTLYFESRGHDGSVR